VDTEREQMLRDIADLKRRVEVLEAAQPSPSGEKPKRK